MNATDPNRIRVDWKNLPLGVVPQLEKDAALKGLSVSMLCRTIVIEYALTKGKK